jgi:predicted Kef-type K+ transport protein
VQVESLAQVGVQLLLFTLGLEFSLSKLRAVRSVALLGAPLRPLIELTCRVRMHLSSTMSWCS